MEANSGAAPEAPVLQGRTGDSVRAFFNRYALVIILLALPVVFAIQDLKNDGNLAHLANNLFSGLSNGTIIALIATGYTLVYGIIELINFAHGDVFMIGSFTAPQFWSCAFVVTIATALSGTLGRTVASVVVARVVC